MKIKPQQVFALALMGTPGAWAAEGANAQSSLDFFNSSLAPLSAIKAFLDSKSKPMEQAYQAVELSNSIVVGGRNGMQNANAALQLNFTDPIRTFEQLKASTRASSKLDGDALYKQMIDDAVERTKVGTCFVAGTLVHTQTGLVPIEQIKVGDYVLSKPESGEGELSYQKVTKTFVHENQPILCVIVYPEREVVAAATENKLIEKSLFIPLLVTQNHPFWVQGKGWVDANKLHIGVDKLRLADGTLAFIDDVNTVMRMDNPSWGWLMDGVRCPIRRSDLDSHWIDVSENKVVGHLGISDRIENNAIEWLEQNPEDRLLRTVYNIEVENTHTYFVGTEGVWVHNKNAALRGEGLDVALDEASRVKGARLELASPDAAPANDLRQLGLAGLDA